MLLRILSGLAVVSLALSTAPRAQDLVKIGLVAPITGPLAVFGQELNGGAQAAVRDINEKGGINGRKVELIVKDDGCAPDKSRLLVEELATKDKAVAAIGLPCPLSALAAREVARTYKMLILPLASTPDLTRGEIPEILRPIGRADGLAAMAADVLRNRFPGKKVAWLGSESSQFGLFFRAAAAKHHLDVTPFVSNAPPNDQLLQTMSGYDVMLISRLVPPEWLQELVAKAPASTIVLALDTLRPQDIEPLQKASNVVLVSNPEPGFVPSAGKEARPAGYFPYGYASIQIVAALATTTKDLSGDKLAEAARKADIPTVLGKLRFNVAGDVQGLRFWLWERIGSTTAPYATIDVCKSPNCKDYTQCPPTCPTP